MDMEVFLQKEHRNSRRPWSWRSHFRPQNCGQAFYGHEDFSEKLITDRFFVLKKSVTLQMQIWIDARLLKGKRFHQSYRNNRAGRYFKIQIQIWTSKQSPSQQTNACAFFVLGPELGIQFINTYVKNSEHHRLWIRYTYLPLARECLFFCRYKYTYMKITLVNKFEFNTNTYTWNNRQEFKMYLFPRTRCYTLGGTVQFRRGGSTSPMKSLFGRTASRQGRLWLLVAPYLAIVISVCVWCVS